MLASMLVGNQQIHLDVMEELEPHIYRFGDWKIRGSKLQSSSPLREDKHPSFAVNLETGAWKDSGAFDNRGEGHFLQLLAYITGQDFMDVEDYLLSKYGIATRDLNTLKLDMSVLKLSGDKRAETIREQDLPICDRYLYLKSRGIKASVAKSFGCFEKDNAVGIPWYNRKGEIINVKFRSILDKKFWYLKEGQVKEHVYGLDKANNFEVVFIVESELDCLLLWSWGLPAVALGSASLSDEQLKLLLGSRIKHFILAMDNDAVGSKAQRYLRKVLEGKKQLGFINLPPAFKDVGDIPESQFEKVLERSYYDIKLRIV